MHLEQFKTYPYPCSYLPLQEATTLYRIGVTDERTYGEMLRRGWRRFGYNFFRPACSHCQRCISLRIPVADFKPDRSQKRNLIQNANITVTVQPPTLTPDHLRLYDEYHQDMHTRKGWPSHEKSPESYERSFLDGAAEYAREFLYHENGNLVAVGLADVLSDALSSIYFFHDPALRSKGLGVYSVLSQLRYAAQNNLTYQYLGYWIEESGSMAYKASYRPHQLLVGRPNDDQEPIWTENKIS